MTAQVNYFFDDLSLMTYLMPRKRPLANPTANPVLEPDLYAQPTLHHSLNNRMDKSATKEI
jgi:hypothetical protein